MINKPLVSKNLLINQKKIFNLISSIVNKYPFFVVIILHEYLRNIEPHDPHIKFKINDPKKEYLNYKNRL